MVNSLEKEIEVDSLSNENFNTISDFLRRNVVFKIDDRNSRNLKQLAHRADMSIRDLRYLREKIKNYFNRVEQNFTNFPENHFNEFGIEFSSKFFIGTKVNSYEEEGDSSEVYVKKNFLVSLNEIGGQYDFELACKISEDDLSNNSFYFGISDKNRNFDAPMIYSMIESGHYKDGRAQLLHRNFTDKIELRKSSINSARDQMISYVLEETRKSL